jgi:bifunctional non-homologous end joining protein LigD
MLARVERRPFDSPSHLFELLWDGVRALAFVEGGRVRFQDRHLADVTTRFPELGSIAEQARPGTVLDGAIVALDGDGQPDFRRLCERLAADDGAGASVSGESPVTFQAFDVLYWKGKPVMDYPLWRRKNLLLQAVQPDARITVPEHMEVEGVAFFEAARDHGLPGIVAKRRMSVYEPGCRGEAWLKLRVYEKEEFVIGGFTYGGRPRDRRRRPREPFASLLLGLYDERGDLTFAGEVGGGFTEASARHLVRVLDRLVTPASPFRAEPQTQRLVFWCRPELAASVRFSEWMPEGRLRFPVFEALRPDVPPPACRLPSRDG